MIIKNKAVKTIIRRSCVKEAFKPIAYYIKYKFIIMKKLTGLYIVSEFANAQSKVAFFYRLLL